VSDVPLAGALVETTKEAAMGFGRVLKRIGTVAAAPVVIPARAATQKVERYAMRVIIEKTVRHLLAGVGVWLMAEGVDPGAWDAVIGAIVTLVSFAWSVAPIVLKYFAEKRTQPAQ
jgi:hypothetical protein